MAKTESGTAVEEKDPAIEEREDAPKVESKPEVKDERRKDEPREDGPPPNTPRWNEVYGKWKATERKLEERDRDVEAMREHNRQLESRLTNLEQTKADRPPEPEPDPAVDPDAYKAWHEMRRLKEREDWDRQRAVDRHETQVEMQKEVHGEEQYLAMVKIAERDMAKDPDLKKKVWASGNPAKEAFRYGEKRAKEMQEKDKEDESRETAKRQTDTEQTGDGGEPPEEKETEKLTEAETRVVRNLFGDDPKGKEKYIKQRKALGR